MPTLVTCAGFEHGVISASGGGLFNSVSGTLTCDGTIKRTGNYSLKIDAANEYAGFTWTATAITVGRFYFLVHSMPSGADAWIYSGGTAATYPNFGIEVTTNKLYLAPTSGGTKTYWNAGASLALDTWYRVDFKFNWGVNPHTFDWKVDGIDQTQTSAAEAGTTQGNGIFGTQVTSPTVEYYIDDYVISTTSGDYPIGAGGVVGLQPSSDGTHANASGYMEDQDGTDINATTNPAYVELSDTDWTSMADYIQQITDSATHYAEVNFDDTTQTVIQGVMAYLSYHCGSANANDGETRIRDAAGQETVIYNGDMSEKDVLFYKSALVTVPAATWSLTTVNGLTCRVGYSGDANPDPLWDAVMLEVAYGTVTPWVPKIIFIG